jgi:hypothetical protein
MKNRNVLRLFTVIAFLSLSVGCTPKQNTNESPKIRAYRLIDSDREDEAIALLSAQLETPGLPDEQIREYTVILSSAYSKKSGVDFKKLARFAEFTDRVLKLDLDKEQKIQLEQNLEPKTAANDENQQANDMKTFARGLARQSQIFLIISKIPQVTEDNLDYLEYSIFLLDNLAKKTAGDHLFLALNKIIFARSLFQSHKINELVQVQDEEKNASCTVDLKSFTEKYKYVIDVLVSALHDLAIANPEQKLSLTRNSETLRNSANSLALLAKAGPALQNILNPGILSFLHELKTDELDYGACL